MTMRRQRPLTPAEIETALRRMQRQQERAAIREGRHAEYRRNGLNGPQAVARRQRQQARIEAKAFETRAAAFVRLSEGASHG
ncbi:MAG: hypothetical protein AB7F22_10380 [Reyranella sp.]|uniref:hypothetical protein n=1 Tax=Reyranella sp. TaxID=1929291 RepID=UPI003D0E51C0